MNAAVPKKLLTDFVAVISSSHLKLASSAGATDCQVVVAKEPQPGPWQGPAAAPGLDASDVVHVIIIYEFPTQRAYAAAVATTVAFNGPGNAKKPLGMLVGLDKLFGTDKTGVQYSCNTGDATRLSLGM